LSGRFSPLSAPLPLNLFFQHPLTAPLPLTPFSARSAPFSAPLRFPLRSHALLTNHYYEALKPSFTQHSVEAKFIIFTKLHVN